MEPKLTIEEEALVEKHMRSESILREWNLLQTRRNERIALVFYLLVCVGTVVGTGYYFVKTDPVLIYKGTSGLFIVLALAIATVLLRVFQRRVQHKNCVKFRDELRKNLIGSPERDVPIQADIQKSADWGARRLDWAACMIAVAMVIIEALNMNQTGLQDTGRSMVYFGCIAVFALGHFWNSYRFRDEFLTSALRARVEAAVRYQKRNVPTERIDRLIGD